MNPFRTLFGRPPAGPGRSSARPAAALKLEALEDRSVPAVVGAVFLDFNANGQRDLGNVAPTVGNPALSVAVANDRGVAGVTVTAYDAAGSAVGSAVTDANGAYAIASTVAGQQYKLLFTGLAAGSYVGPYRGGTSGTAVQFVDGAGTGNLGIAEKGSFNATAPRLATTCYVLGSLSDPAVANEAAVVTFAYGAGTNPSDTTLANYLSGAMKRIRPELRSDTYRPPSGAMPWAMAHFTPSVRSSCILPPHSRWPAFWNE